MRKHIEVKQTNETEVYTTCSTGHTSLHSLIDASLDISITT